MAENIYAVSSDGDDSLYNKAYYKDRVENPTRDEKTRVALCNDKKIKYIGARVEQLQPKQKKQFCGSARQSPIIDYRNAKRNNTDLFINTLRYFSELIGFDLDDYWMSDSYSKKKAGSGFAEAKHFHERGEEPKNCADWVFDESKFSMLWAQMQKVASENPEATIYFDFFDDRYHPEDREEDLVQNLQDFFSVNTIFIPHNVKLRLHHYDGGEVKPLDEIIGTGSIDMRYEQTLRQFVEHAGIDLASKQAYNKTYNFINMIQSTKLMGHAFVFLQNTADILQRYLNPRRSREVKRENYQRELDDRRMDYELALAELESMLAKDLQAMPAEQHKTSTQAKIAIELAILKNALSTPSLTTAEKQEAINYFRARGKTLTNTFGDYFKAMMLVASAAVGFVIGAALGSIIPVVGSVALGTAGFAAGTAISGFLLFKPSSLQSKLNEVAEKAEANLSLSPALATT